MTIDDAGAGLATLPDDEPASDAHLHAEQRARDALAYAENIIATLREPFLVLDGSLRVQTVNTAFLDTFHVSEEETVGHLVFDLGSRQWDIPRLRTLLLEVLPQKQSFQDYEVAHSFLTIGPKVMLLNARRLESSPHCPELILLAIEDITHRRRAESVVQKSEVQYRRLFEAGKDGILILDADERGDHRCQSVPANSLLGYSHAQYVGKQLWEIGLFARQIRERSGVPRPAGAGLRALRSSAAGDPRRAAH